MKKLIPFLFAVVLFASCEKDPDLDKVQNQFVVYTQHDKNADFASAKTYYIPDSVLLITNEPTAKYWTGKDADAILDAFISNMDSRGYVKTAHKDSADLGIQVSYLESTNYFVDYDDYWWNGYPGYWGPGYWGDWNSWYYPYGTVYSYSTGSFLSEIVDLRETADESNKLTVVWNAYMTGLLSGSNTLNLNRAVGAVNQAFAQSAYIKSTAK